MACPLYEDFTRGCVTEFKEVVNLIDFKDCESEDEYKTCPFYRIINKEVTICEHTQFCRDRPTLGNLTMDVIKDHAINYCFSEGKVNCAVYKLMKEGKDVPDNLLADGSKVELKSQ